MMKIISHVVSSEMLSSSRHRSIDTVTQTVCVRCLTPTEVPLHVPIQETWFYKTSAERAEEEATGKHVPVDRSYEGDELDVTEDLRELIMSELPQRALCREDC